MNAPPPLAQSKNILIYAGVPSLALPLPCWIFCVCLLLFASVAPRRKFGEIALISFLSYDPMQPHVCHAKLLLDGMG